MFRAVLLFLVVCVWGCEAAGVREVDARLVGVNASQVGELEGVVAELLGAPKVTLADDVFALDSRLIVERSLSTGRDLDRPAHVRLVKSGANCVLIHEESGSRAVLGNFRCEALETGES